MSVNGGTIKLGPAKSEAEGKRDLVELTRLRGSS